MRTFSALVSLSKPSPARDPEVEQGPCAPAGHPPGHRGGGSSGARRPWLCTHTVSATSAGVALKAYGVPGNPTGKGAPARGEITEFSAAARRRMREFILGFYVPNCTIVEGTNTIPGEVTPEEFRNALRLWSTMVFRSGGAVVWRVELQKRKQPHLHFIGYSPHLPEDWTGTVHPLAVLACPDAWLQCLPERCARHSWARRRAVHAKLHSVESFDWLGYVNAHASKHKREQLGWLGKQWGIINKAAFKPRPQLWQVHMSDRQGARVKRWFSNYIRSKIQDPRRRARFRGIGRGSWQRFCDPELVRRLVALACSSPLIAETQKRSVRGEASAPRRGKASTTAPRRG